MRPSSGIRAPGERLAARQSVYLSLVAITARRIDGTTQYDHRGNLKRLVRRSRSRPGAGRSCALLGLNCSRAIPASQRVCLEMRVAKLARLSALGAAWA